MTGDNRMPAATARASRRRPPRPPPGSPPPRDTSPDRSRGARGARRRAGDAGADPRPGPGPARSWRGAVRRRSGPRWRACRRPPRHRPRAAAIARSRRSPSTRSTVSRSIPFRRSSSRIARSPRGRARSRDSTQIRANASSSSIPSSVILPIAPSTSSARYPAPPSRRRTSDTDRDRTSRKRAAASSTTAGSSIAARRSRRSANDSFRALVPATRPGT